MMKKIFWILLSGMIVLSACKEEVKKSETVKTVKVESVVSYGGSSTISFPGKVKAATDINVAFRISGPIAKIYKKEGDIVKKGDILAEMDSRDYSIQFSATEAEYKQIKAEAERIIQLYEKNSASQNDYDKAVSGLKQITAKYNAHKNALEDTKLTAPFDGYIHKRYYDEREIVAAGYPIFSIMSNEAPEVVINIPAKTFINRDQFSKYYCRFDLHPDKIFPLELVSVSQKANLNQLYPIRLRLSSNENVYPGMSTMVTIEMTPDNSNLVSIPINAMFEKDGKHVVWVYDTKTSKVNLREITPTEIPNDGTVIVSDGLKEDEKVVTAGVHSLMEGDNVKMIKL